MRTVLPTQDEVWAVLHEVPDPEVPVLSVVDLSIIRAVEIGDDAVTVSVTPTYSGCPAMRVIEADIVAALEGRGIPARVRTVFAPAWTSDWISADARRRLKEYGIAPPGPAGDEDDVLVPLRRRRATAACPYCDSADTELRSAFGSTACKSIAYCNACRQPFEVFKAI